MIMAKRQFRRLWYPEPGGGGDIASRAEHALSRQDFDRHMPEEFWREVVDRCAGEAPDTLLLAEAFWMMEGYFVRTLGMHRVYNSAFMNMLKKEENAKYRETIKNTQEFDKDILKRFVNFMNNPDEDTAVAQFGKGDNYFGVCTLMATLPGLPMFGHGQIEGFEEKYGMEYRRAYRDETPDADLVARHEREIFPLLKRRHLFSGVDDFLLYDFWDGDGRVNENVFAYSNRSGGERALVAYNNAYARASGWIRISSSYAEILPDGAKRLRPVLPFGRARSQRTRTARFLVFREQRSGLWFLRPSREIAARGSAPGSERIRKPGLPGRVRSPGRRFRPLRHPLRKPERRRHTRRLGRAPGHGSQGALRGVLGPIVPGSFWPPCGPRSPSPARPRRTQQSPREKIPRVRPKSRRPPARLKPMLPEASTSWRRPAAPSRARPGSSWAIFRPIRSLPRIEAASPKTTKAAGKTAGKDTAAATADALLAGFRDLATFRAEAEKKPGVSFPGLLAAEYPRVLEAAAALVLFGSLRVLLGPGARGEDARALVDRWCLDRKLREALQASGVPGDEAWRLANAAKTACALSPAKPDAAALWNAWTTDEDGQRILGVNTWDGVSWFRKEGMDLATVSAALALIFAPGAPGDYPVRAAAAKRVHAALRKAEAASGYRMDGMNVNGKR